MNTQAQLAPQTAAEAMKLLIEMDKRNFIESANFEVASKIINTSCWEFHMPYEYPDELTMTQTKKVVKMLQVYDFSPSELRAVYDGRRHDFDFFKYRYRPENREHNVDLLLAMYMAKHMTSYFVQKTLEGSKEKKFIEKNLYFLLVVRK